jgi:hypothetical protein
MLIEILWPTLALVALVFVVWLVMNVQRFALLKRNPPTREQMATADAALRYFQPVEMSANNLRNLFEMPVLYFALVSLLMITGLDGMVQVVLAWVYVALRALHSYVHIVVKNPMRRFQVYLLSCVVLSAMWIGFAIRLIAAG